MPARIAYRNRALYPGFVLRLDEDHIPFLTGDTEHLIERPGISSNYRQGKNIIAKERSVIR
jgi:hypothetical protein